MNLKHLSNSDLHQHTIQKADSERLATIDLLWHLREVERRMLFAQMGYPDLKVYCIKELKLSEGSAWRRINAMRLLKELPEVESKIQSGNLNLTQVTMARAYFREVTATTQEKKKILLTLETQSTRATERILAECKPEGYIPTFQETEKAGLCEFRIYFLQRCESSKNGFAYPTKKFQGRNRHRAIAIYAFRTRSATRGEIT